MAVVTALAVCLALLTGALTLVGLSIAPKPVAIAIVAAHAVSRFVAVRLTRAILAARAAFETLGTSDGGGFAGVRSALVDDGGSSTGTLPVAGARGPHTLLVLAGSG